MAPTRTERVNSHKKQERLQVQNGVPSVSDMKEGVPEVRYVGGVGLVEYIRFKNVLHKKKLDRSGDKIIKLTDSTAGTANGDLLDTTVDNTTTDDLSTLVAKINEIIEKIN